MIPLADISFTGSGLKRPECVLAPCLGHTGCTRLDGRRWREPGCARRQEVSAILCHDRPADDPLRPNGNCAGRRRQCPDGLTWVTRQAVFFRLRPDGTSETVICELDGEKLPPCNFVIADGTGGLWLTVSTRRVPRALGYRKDVDDGFIVHIPATGAPRIAADGLGLYQ